MLGCKVNKKKANLSKIHPNSFGCGCLLPLFGSPGFLLYTHYRILFLSAGAPRHIHPCLCGCGGRVRGCVTCRRSR